MLDFLFDLCPQTWDTSSFNTYVMFSLLSTRGQPPQRNFMPRTPAGLRASFLPPKQLDGAPRSWCKYQPSPEYLHKIWKCLCFSEIPEERLFTSSRPVIIRNWNVYKNEELTLIRYYREATKQEIRSGALMSFHKSFYTVLWGGDLLLLMVWNVYSVNGLCLFCTVAFQGCSRSGGAGQREVWGADGVFTWNRCQHSTASCCFQGEQQVFTLPM